MNGNHFARHRFMMSFPRLWPCHPFLPLIRTHSGRPLELGVMLAAHAFGLSSGPVVVCANLLLLPEARHELLKLPCEQFNSVDGVLAAGWRVD